VELYLHSQCLHGLMFNEAQKQLLLYYAIFFVIIVVFPFRYIKSLFCVLRDNMYAEFMLGVDISERLIDRIYINLVKVHYFCIYIANAISLRLADHLKMKS
jgi:hypothetical protein